MSRKVSEIVHLSSEWQAETFRWAEMANGDLVIWSRSMGNSSSGWLLWVYSTSSFKCVARLALDSPMKSLPCVATSRNLMVVASQTKMYIYKGGSEWATIFNPVDFCLLTFRRLDFVRDESALVLSSRDGWHMMNLDGKVYASMDLTRLGSMLELEATINPISHACLDSSTLVLFLRPFFWKSPLIVWDLKTDTAYKFVDQQYSPHKDTFIFGIDSLENGRLVTYCTDKVVVWKAYDKTSWEWDPAQWRKNIVGVVNTSLNALAVTEDNKILSVNRKGLISIFQVGTVGVTHQASIDSRIEDCGCFYRQGVEDVFFLQDRMTKHWICLQFLRDEAKWQIVRLPCSPYEKTPSRAIQPVLTKNKTSPLFECGMTREGIRVVFGCGVFRMVMPPHALKNATSVKHLPHVHEELMATLYAPPDPSYDFPGGVLYCQLAESTTFGK